MDQAERREGATGGGSSVSSAYVASIHPFAAGFAIRLVAGLPRHVHRARGGGHGAGVGKRFDEGALRSKAPAAFPIALSWDRHPVIIVGIQPETGGQGLRGGNRRGGCRGGGDEGLERIAHPRG